MSARDNFTNDLSQEAPRNSDPLPWHHPEDGPARAPLLRNSNNRNLNNHGLDTEGSVDMSCLGMSMPWNRDRVDRDFSSSQNQNHTQSQGYLDQGHRETGVELVDSTVTESRYVSPPPPPPSPESDLPELRTSSLFHTGLSFLSHLLRPQIERNAKFYISYINM